MIDQALIFAAGFGKRLQPLTLTTPKPLIDLNGKPLIQYALDRLNSAGIKKTVVNTHYLAEQLHDYLKDKNVIISHEPEILETGGGLLNALPNFKPEPILCLNSDIWWQENHGSILKNLIKAWDDQTMDILLILVTQKNALYFKGPGDFDWNKETLIPTFRQGDSAPFIYTGIQIIHPRVFVGQESGCFSIVDIYHKVAKSNRLRALELDGTWCDIGTLDALESLRR